MNFDASDLWPSATLRLAGSPDGTDDGWTNLHRREAFLRIIKTHRQFAKDTLTKPIWQHSLNASSTSKSLVPATMLLMLVNLGSCSFGGRLMLAITEEYGSNTIQLQMLSMVLPYSGGSEDTALGLNDAGDLLHKICIDTLTEFTEPERMLG
jgi:hypothetical protein